MLTRTLLIPGYGIGCLCAGIWASLLPLDKVWGLVAVVALAIASVLLGHKIVDAIHNEVRSRLRHVREMLQAQDDAEPDYESRTPEDTSIN